MPLMTAAAAILTIVGMAAVVSKKGCPPLLSFTAGSLGLIMLAVLTVPGFSNYTASALTAAVLAPLLGQRLLTKIRTGSPLAGEHKAPFLLAVVDVGFMALALLLMPTHGTEAMQASLVGGVHGGHGSPTASGASVMGAAVLIGWTTCTMILAVPELRRRSQELVGHAVCSVCMTLAMGVMAL
jgi:hypothetical protein